jgi:hypothetical protein
MNLHEASEIRELTSDEMHHVSGGFGALWNVTKDAVIYAVSVAEDW